MPVVSLEGNREQTDDRRGAGVYDSVMRTLTLLSRKRVMFGGSITLTSENFNTVLSREYVFALVELGMKLFFFVEYVPFDPATETLEVTSCQKAELPARLESLRAEFPAIFLDFPGDEAAFGGCLASGRGFVHINATGSVESCPFAPYSDSSVADVALSDALSSPVLSRIRALQEDLGHTGGCTLFENRDRVEALLAAR
jgi:MoaA/NifB/PqqE/SkfB family radical SAM enzyme